MNWLHTWVGVVVGGLLFAIFWTGTLSLFDKEIDLWMAPQLRLALPEKSGVFGSVRASYEDAVTSRAPQWSINFPNERLPVARVTYRDGQNVVRQLLDPSTGAVLRDPETWGGSQFIYPFHFSLHLRSFNLGIWLVGLAGMAMLVLCISGVVIHRKIFADFFTFRPQKKSGRMLLDLHAVAGVLGLPFHIAITLSGLIIFWFLYFPSGWQAAYPDRPTFLADAFDSYSRPKANMPGTLAPLDAMVEKARDLWGADVRSLSIQHPGDAAAYVSIRAQSDDAVQISGATAYFDAATGALLHQRIESRPIMTAQRFISGFHMVQFRHWTLRWLYFLLGLAGCVMIATGHLFWLESRRKRHAQLNLSGVRIVEALAAGSITGIVVATLAFFTSNRLLSPGLTILGYERAALEAWVFFLAWIASLGHAWLRRRRMWTEQCLIIASLAVVAVGLNWITTGDHLMRSLAHRHLWPVAGTDLMLLVGALVATLSARRLLARAP